MTAIKMTGQNDQLCNNVAANEMTKCRILDFNVATKIYSW